MKLITNRDDITVITCHISDNLEKLGRRQIGLGIFQLAISQEPLKMQNCRTDKKER